MPFRNTTPEDRANFTETLKNLSREFKSLGKKLDEAVVHMAELNITVANQGDLSNIHLTDLRLENKEILKKNMDIIYLLHPYKDILGYLAVFS